jgi:hypothetical protein
LTATEENPDETDEKKGDVTEQAPVLPLQGVCKWNLAMNTDDSCDIIVNTTPPTPKGIWKWGQISGQTNRKARVFRSDSPPVWSRRSIGSGGESSSMLSSVEGNAVQAFSKGNNFLPYYANVSQGTSFSFHEISEYRHHRSDLDKMLLLPLLWGYVIQSVSLS